MTRSWMKRTVLAGSLVAIAGTYAWAIEDNTLLRGVQSEYGPKYSVKMIVVKDNVVPPVGPPGQIPDDSQPPKTVPNFAAGDSKLTATNTSVGGSIGGGIGLIPAASPEVRLENSLKGLARDLR